MSSVFLCHSSKDKRFVHQLANRLRSYGIHVWIDEAEMRVGESLTKRLGAAIEESDYVVAVLSRHSVNSEWVQRELQVALQREFAERKVLVLPLLLDKVIIPPFLRDKLYADFTDKRQSEKSFAQVLKAVGISSEHLVRTQALNFIFHTLHHTLRILDNLGDKAIWEKQTTATPLHFGINLWRDEQYYGSGKLNFLRSEPGSIKGVECQGNTFTVLTRFDPAPKPNAIFTRTLYVQADKCFTQEYEDFSWVPLCAFEEFGIHIILPPDRPFRDMPIANYIISTQEYSLDQGRLSAEMTAFDLLISRPIQEARYVVKWHW